jgi:hypothetical protein|tara:strand:- start:270 stop:455 length:186 start_codon:yes stop_codon:yes gene_type:complete
VLVEEQVVLVEMEIVQHLVLRGELLQEQEESEYRVLLMELLHIVLVVVVLQVMVKLVVMVD